MTQQSFFPALYRQYSDLQGRTPQQQLAHDDGLYHGGGFVRFHLWLEQVKSRFRVEHPECVDGRGRADERKLEEFVAEKILKKQA